MLLVLAYFVRDGMIKRPGCEGYLNKMVEEERKAFSETLLLGTSMSFSEEEDTGLVLNVTNED